MTSAKVNSVLKAFASLHPATQLLSASGGMARQTLQGFNDVDSQGTGVCQSPKATSRDKKSLVEEAVRILSEPDARLKAEKTHILAQMWAQKQLPAGQNVQMQVPKRPGRADNRVGHAQSPFW